MIDFANRNRGDASAFDAILAAGVRRFRPILLTTATTFFGLAPIIFERSLQAQYIVPMAISLGFGIVFATAIILVLVPCLYLVLDDLMRLFGAESERAGRPIASAARQESQAVSSPNRAGASSP
jgi:Cu/Ag efflux pump CusA